MQATLWPALGKEWYFFFSKGDWNWVLLIFFFLPRPPGGFKKRSIFNSVEIEKGDQSYKNLEIFLLQRPASVPQLFHFQVPEINASENESFKFRSSPLNEMCSGVNDPIPTTQKLFSSCEENWI